MRVTHTFLLTHIIILGTGVTDADTAAPHPRHARGHGTQATNAHTLYGSMAPGRLLSASPGLSAPQGPGPPRGAQMYYPRQGARCTLRASATNLCEGFYILQAAAQDTQCLAGQLCHRVPADPLGALWRCNMATEVPPHSTCACRSSHQSTA